MGLVETLARENIRRLVPYTTARDEFGLQAEVYLDANENPHSRDFNRYPDPYQRKLKERLSVLKGVNPSNIFISNGSDEVIDLLIRAFCEPKRDAILIVEPTYGMYSVCASINDVRVQQSYLREDFTMDAEGVLQSVSDFTKIVFLCSPNNPTGNLLNAESVEVILKGFNGLVAIDEAYIDFTNQESFVSKLSTFPNLVVIQTMSKAWGLAGLRLGMCFASEEIVQLLSRMKHPYNVNAFTQEKALDVLSKGPVKEQWTKEIVVQREKLAREMMSVGCVEKVFPSDANFLLVKMKDAKRVYGELLKSGVVVRDRSSSSRCENCLRITVGTTDENVLLIKALSVL